MPEISFNSQAAIITGAGSGIGRATALLLAARGAQVLVNDVDPAHAEATVHDVRKAGGTAIADTTPVGSHETARAIAAKALAAFGRIDILVNNAGIARPGPFDAISDEALDRVMAVNLTGPYALMRAVWPAMRDQAYGRIVNLSSSAALGSGISGPYAVSKAGLIGLTKDAGIAGKPLGILVNAVMPQANTPLLDNHPDAAFRDWMRRFPPEAVAVVIAFLASREMSESAEIYAAGGGRAARVAFVVNRGHYDPALTPEGVRDCFAAISDLEGGTPVSTQADHETLQDTVFPGRPGH
jgi:NAD(P)-dependent dehydrogenase (short-subunit alcohol dehydrogenase family)